MNVGFDGVNDRPCVERAKKEISVELLGGKTTVDALDSVTIEDVQRTDLSMDDQELFYLGSHLDDDKSLDYVDTGDELTMNLLTRLRGGMTIFAKMIDGRVVALEVLPKEIVADVKRKIEEKIGLSADEQKLIFKRNILEDDKTVEDCDIFEGSLVNVIKLLRRGMQIFAKTMDWKIFMLELCPTATVADVKMKIQGKISLYPDEQKLVFRGAILEDDKTVDQYQITEKSVIDVVVQLRDSMKIFVNTMDGIKMALDVMKTETAVDVKRKIQEKIVSSPDEQRLYFQGRQLGDDETMRQCQITRGSAMNVVIPLKNGMQTFAKTMDGKTVAFEVRKTETIADVRKKIEEKIGLSLDHKMLMFQGGILEDDKTVDYYKIRENSVIHVIAQSRNGMQIFAKNMDGKTIAFEVRKTETIADVKKKIEQRIGLSPDEQKFVFEGRILEDDKTVDYYEIRENSVINVVVRLRDIPISIWIRNANNKREMIDVLPTETVASLKRKIQRKTGNAPTEMVLYCGTQPLADDKTLSYYGVTVNSELHLKSEINSRYSQCLFI